MQTIDRTGCRFGRLVVIACVGTHARSRRPLWCCLCDCRAEIVVVDNALYSGNTRSCGCLRREQLAARNRANATHGESSTPEFSVWGSILDRIAPHSKDALCYHARGIGLCVRWESYENFLADMGRRPSPDHSIDRIDNDRGYEPGNCRWATAREQARNRRNNRLITFRGETLCVAEWAERVGIERKALAHRLNHWPLEQALTTPLHCKRTQ